MAEFERKLLEIGAGEFPSPPVKDSTDVTDLVDLFAGGPSALVAPSSASAPQISRKGKRGPVSLKEVNKTLHTMHADIGVGKEAFRKMSDRLEDFENQRLMDTAALEIAQKALIEDVKGIPRVQPHIGLGGVHHNTYQAPVQSSSVPGSSVFPRPELRDPYPITQGTHKIYDTKNPPKKSDFLEQALFGSVHVTPRLASKAEWQKMTGYVNTPAPPPPSSKTPFGKYVEPRRPVEAFALSPAGPIQGSEEPGLAASGFHSAPVFDLTKKFSIVGH